MAVQSSDKIHLPHFVHTGVTASSEVSSWWGRTCAMSWVALRCLRYTSALLCAGQSYSYCQMDCWKPEARIWGRKRDDLLQVWTGSLSEQFLSLARCCLWFVILNRAICLAMLVVTFWFPCTIKEEQGAGFWWPHRDPGREQWWGQISQSLFQLLW